MRKLWRMVSYIAMSCLLLGVLGIAVGFFTGGSPSTLMAHGHLAEYGERLAMNRDILLDDWARLSAFAQNLWQQAAAQVRAWLAALGIM